MPGRFVRQHYLESLDPYKHHQEIHRLSSTEEFPWDYGRGLEIAMLRTCCVPAISSVLDLSGEFAGHALKRYDDTRILLGELVAHGYESTRGKDALRQINRAHQRYDINNEDMLYVLSAFVYEPIRWIDRWGWRNVTETEKIASFVFFVNVGRRMGIKSMPASVADFEAFNQDYERRRFAYAGANQRVSEQILKLYASWYPRPVRRVAGALLRSRLDGAVRNALGVPEPSRWAAAAQATILRSHALAERFAPELAARLFSRPIARSYPNGYEIVQVGAHSSALSSRPSSPPAEPLLSIRMRQAMVGFRLTQTPSLLNMDWR